MADQDIAQMAHLMRRAGFGATRDELESYVAKGYEATVEELLHPESAPPALDHEDIIRRYHVDNNSFFLRESGQAYWIYRMINTCRPLEEKIALFWHCIFATGESKIMQPNAMVAQVEMFRRYGFGSFHTLLTELSKDPAMIFFLDNKDNHMGEVNENYGRELLELFSMGVGNYTEDDVRQASRAFTGWTMLNASYHTARVERDSVWPYGRMEWRFQYKDDDHDDGEKLFLGRTGAFNGEDIIDIVCAHPATARFISRHMYNFFVADEPQVPAWKTVPPRDPAAIQTLADAFVEYEYDIRSVLRVLFNSDFFKEAAFAKVKSPAELVVGTVRLAGTFRFPEFVDTSLPSKSTIMGQQLMDPPSVEGWHTGDEWITTGSLVDRVNFATMQFANAAEPGIRSLVDRIAARSAEVSPEDLVDACLDWIGPMTVSEDTRREMLERAAEGGRIRLGTEAEARSASERVAQILQLIVATREYQLT